MGGNYLRIPAKNVLTDKGWPVPGNYYILAVADALKYIAEISETNNQRKAPIAIKDAAVASPYCGDATCTGGENHTSCPIDCP